MNVNSYRRRLEQQVERAREKAAEKAGPAAGRRAGIAAAAPSGKSLDKAHVEPLRRLADEQEEPSVRLAALEALKVLAFSSPTFPDWRPAFLEALRAAVEEPALRAAALEVLTQQKDRPTVEQLLAGLRNPDEAIVKPDQALRLLANDPHADALDVAQRIADDPPSENARREALALLAADPGSVERFRSLLTDPAESVPVRKLAATALSQLAPEDLPAVAESATRKRKGARRGVAAEAAAGGEDAQLAKHLEALLRARQ